MWHLKNKTNKNENKLTDTEKKDEWGLGGKGEGIKVYKLLVIRTVTGM